ncbi:MAG TPA: DNA polymerase Y family protein, partial [Gammaproteobacteria bacterium]|nr:DNA polymerase Y family protein [Gammaproteobacteria bacterium]
MARALKPLALLLGEVSSSPQRGAPLAESSKPQLWLAVRLPELVLEAVSGTARRSAEEVGSYETCALKTGAPKAAGTPHKAGALQKAGARKAQENALQESINKAARTGQLAIGRPIAVVEPRRGRLFVAAVNPAARSLGIKPGLGLSAAFGFSGSLQVLERSLQAESAQLEALAACCGRFTPLVSVAPPDSLLLEVQASLRLFGGLEAIKTALGSEIRRRGFTARLTAAPTPLGALWLVRGRAEDALSLGRLQSLANPLPLAVTHWPAPIQNLLADMGARTLGDCLRLPRAGFARRAGPDYLHQLDKALGKLPDPRAAFAAPELLNFKVELFEQTTDLATLAAAVERMSEALAAELRGRQAEVLCLELVLEHVRRPSTVLSCELVESAHDARRFAELLCDKLERARLPVPTA